MSPPKEGTISTDPSFYGLTDLDIYSASGYRFLQNVLGYAIPLSVYLKETPTSILAHQMELLAAPELISGAIKDKVIPYLARHKLPKDKFLLRFVRGSVLVMGTHWVIGCSCHHLLLIALRVPPGLC
jgi:hypothetical protein